MTPKPVQRLALLLILALFCASLEAQRGRRSQMPFRWSPDGKYLILSQGGPTRWLDPETLQPVKPVATESSFTPGLEEFAAAITEAGNRVRERNLRGRPNRSTLPRAADPRPEAVSSSDKQHWAALLDGELWAWTNEKKARKVATGLKGVRHFSMAPAGNAVYYIRDNDLYVHDLSAAEGKRLTKDGGENTFNGELDWVYQEEVYGRGNFKAAWFAPDGQHLAFMRTDERGVDTFSVVDHIPNQLVVEQLKYPKAGRTNPRATLKVADLGGTVREVDLSKYEAKDEILIVRVGWTPDANKIVYMVQNRIQNWLELNFADPKTGKSRTLIREECDYGWVERLPMPRWLKDGSFIWESDRTGYRHFYRYDQSGKLLATLSQGEWTAGRVIELDEEHGHLFFYGKAKGYAIGQHAYRAKLDGSECLQITKGRGTHQVAINGDGSKLVDMFMSMENGGEFWLRSIGGKDRELGKSPNKPDNPPVWKQIKARDGETLDVTYRLPRGFHPEKKYPVWISTYSGPDAPSIRDMPSRGRASDWYVLLQVNVRSASGRGHKFTTACYKKFGVQELKDIEDAVDWICKKPWADASRVGITGHSYGGFMTAFALTHSKKFKCGIAGAGVFDWGLYDTIYTERYMSTPQRNPEGYRMSSVTEAAGDLHGQLLIAHGTMDDNVHMQNAIQLIHELQQAGKTNFEFMLYPKSRHGIRSRQYGALREKFMREHL